MTALPEGLAEAVARVATGRDVLFAFDFDGTLAPIVAERSAARMPGDTRAALERLLAGRQDRVALVSGRSLADLRAVAEPPPGVLLVGSHGAEIADGGGGREADPGIDRQLLNRLTVEVEAVVAAHPGTALESKPAGVVLHTRQAERPTAAAATQAVLEGPARLPGVRATPGKEVVELSVVDVDKGRALLALRSHLGVAGVLYVGDDVTDEHAFGVLDDDAGDLTVKVGEGPTTARWRVPGPQTLPALIEAMSGAARG